MVDRVQKLREECERVVERSPRGMPLGEIQFRLGTAQAATILYVLDKVERQGVALLGILDAPETPPSIKRRVLDCIQEEP